MNPVQLRRPPDHPRLPDHLHVSTNPRPHIGITNIDAPEAHDVADVGGCHNDLLSFSGKLAT